MQKRAWRAISDGGHTLVAAPTGTGKTLAGFLPGINALIQEGAARPLPNQTRIVYVSPLKALGRDIEKNLAEPLAGLADRFGVEITTAVRTGDTSANARARMLRLPPHILVTTPEGLYALVTGQGGRKMLSTVKTVIVDEIHALVPDRRGAHLALTLERLEALAGPFQRIGLSATVNPTDRVASFLAGAERDCTIVDTVRPREFDIQIETPGSPLLAITEGEAMEEVYDRICELAAEHRTTLVFVNSRRQCERVSHNLAQRLGSENVAAHHGSLAPPLRLHAEERLKTGKLRCLVATASLELGLDIGNVDLVVQLGATKRISTFLQRVGRSNHRAGGVPKAKLFALTRDELAECVALIRCAQRGDLDAIHIPDAPLDVLAQQIVAETATGEVSLDALYRRTVRAWPWRNLLRSRFDAVVEMVAKGFPTERGRRGILIGLNRSERTAAARKGAKLLAIASGGSIPDTGDYKVRLEPQGVVVGAIAEDFAIHQMPGHVLQLGSNTWRVLQVSSGEVRVEGAPGEAPYMPVWFGESPARSTELSEEVTRIREEIAAAPDADFAVASLSCDWLNDSAARQLVAYLRAGQEAIGRMPSARCVVTERFTDLTGNEQIVVHAPFGQRINRAWALCLRHLLGSEHGVEIQAAATDDGFLLSLPGDVRFAASETLGRVSAATVTDLLTQAVLDVPMFAIRWRWAAARALMVPRMRGGKRVPPHIQRTNADELLLSAFPGLRTGQPMRVEAKMGGARAARAAAADHAVPDTPLVQQSLDDCLHDAMNLDGLILLLERIEAGDLELHHIDRPSPSPMAFNVLTAKPPAFLDNGALMDRRARNVSSGPKHLDVAADVAVLPEAVARVRQEVTPEIESEDDLSLHLSLAGVLSEADDPHFKATLETLAEAGRAVSFRAPNGASLWAAPERVGELAAAFPELGESGEDPVSSLASVLRGRLETSGPISLTEIATPLGLDTAAAQAALGRLTEEGHVLAGQFDPDKPGETVWCDRRVLSRIERLTRNHLRAEVEPVSLRDFYRFLLRWHGLTPETRRQGRTALAEALDQLDGTVAPAGAWEPDVLAPRVARYETDDLDALCLNGQFGWGRLSAIEGKAKLARTTPISIFRAEHAPLWRALGTEGAEVTLSHRAKKVLAAFEAEGAAFAPQIERSIRMMRSDFEAGLAELVALGLMTADSFAGLRALLANPTKMRVSRLDLIANTNAGRWSLLPAPDPLTDPVAYEEAVERYARTLLRRYGVVVRTVVAREATRVRWLDLLRVLRRMEARGEVRGGYFVAGAGGEHFALPEALPMLRKVRASEAEGELAVLAATDPINLTGILEGTTRVPARPETFILVRDGQAVAARVRDKVQMLELPLEEAPLAPADIAVLRAPRLSGSLAVWSR
ncbi:MAG: DEAD/DEAH box helicase [Pseudomonadota bacterium]